MSEPVISIIIPYYKGEGFIQATVQSLLDQQYGRLEIIVVDDGSPKETLPVLESLGDKVSVIHQENQGQAAARNTGIKAAKGSIIGLLDQDDRWPEGRIAKTLPLLGDEQYDFVNGMTQRFRIGADGTMTFDEQTFNQELVGSALYKREVFDTVGLFDETMREGDDFDWTLRLNESACRGTRIADTTLFFQRHDRNQSSLKDNIKNGQMLSIRKKLERARAAMKQ